MRYGCGTASLPRRTTCEDQVFQFPISSLSPRPSALRARGDGPFGATSFGWSAPIPSGEWSAGADSTGLEGKTRETRTERRLRGKIARKGEKAPIQGGQRWHVERATPGTTSSTGCNAASCGPQVLRRRDKSVKNRGLRPGPRPSLQWRGRTRLEPWVTRRPWPRAEDGRCSWHGSWY